MNRHFICSLFEAGEQLSTHRFEVLRSVPFVHCQQVSHLVKDLLQTDEMLEFENTKWFVNYSAFLQ